MKHAARLAMLGLATLTAACQPQKRDNSDVQSLDNAAKAPGESVTLNDCSQPHGNSVAPEKAIKAYSQKIQAVSPDLKEEAVAVLKAAPAKLLQPFFDIGGRVYIVPNAEALCADARGFSEAAQLIDGDQEKAMGCWHKKEGAKAPEILLQAKPGVPKHALVRMLAYVLVEFLAGNAEKLTDLPSDKKADIKKFVENREELAAAFLSEVKTKNQAAYQKLLELSRNAEKQNSNFFVDSVLVEAMDSYACSSRTRQIFQKAFPKTWRVFAADNEHALIRLLDR